MHFVVWYNINMNDIPMPQFDAEVEQRFKELVLREGVATITSIREQMHPLLEEYDDILLIRKMLQILQGGS